MRNGQLAVKRHKACGCQIGHPNHYSERLNETVRDSSDESRPCAEGNMTLFATASELLARRLVHAAFLLPALLLLALVAPQANTQSPILRVARISLIEGEVSYQRAGDSNKDWTDATLNMPLNERDQLYSGQTGRAE